MNKLDFMIMQLKASQSFRAIMERINKNFEVMNANQTNVPQDNSAGQLNNPPPTGDVPSGDVYPVQPVA